MATGDLTATLQANGRQIAITGEGLDGTGITRFQAGKTATISIATSTGYDSSGGVVARTRSALRLKFRSCTAATPGVVTADIEEWVVASGTESGVTLTADAGLLDDGVNTSNAAVAVAVTNSSGVTKHAEPGIRVCSSNIWKRHAAAFSVDVAAANITCKGHRANLGLSRVEVVVTEVLITTGRTGTVAVGDTATGATSGTTATVNRFNSSGYDNKFLLTDVSGPWTAGETINFTSGGSATYSSGGRAVTKSASSMSLASATNGSSASYPIWTCGSFDPSDWDGSGGDAVAGLATIKARAYPTVGGSACIEIDETIWYCYLDPSDAYDDHFAHYDPRGTMSLSTGIDADIAPGDIVIGGTSGARAIVCVAASSGATSIKVAWSPISANTEFTADEALTISRNTITVNTVALAAVATATLSGSPTWNASLAGTVDTTTAFRSLQRACEACKNGHGTYASWSTVYFDGSAAHPNYGTYGWHTFGNAFGTGEGPVLLRRAAGVASGEALLAARASTDGLRTTVVDVEGIDIVVASANLSPLSSASTSAGANGPFTNSYLGLVLRNLRFTGPGRLASNFTTPASGFSTPAVFGMLYDDAFTGLSGAIARDCEYTNIAQDAFSFGAVRVNCSVQADPTGTSAHSDIGQIASGGTKENALLWNVKGLDLVDVQTAPFCNGSPATTVRRYYMVLCRQNVNSSFGSAQLDDVAMESVGMIHCSSNDGFIPVRQDTAAAWSATHVQFARCAWSSLSSSVAAGTVDVPPAIVYDCHLYNDTAFAVNGLSGTTDDNDAFDLTLESSTEAATWVDSANNDWTPAPTATNMLGRWAADDAIIPYDAEGTATSGAYGFIGAEAAAAPTITSIDPATVPLGASGTWTITGTGFVDGITPTVDGGVTLGATIWNSATEIEVDWSPAITAGTGWTMRLTNPDGQYAEITFDVLAGSGIAGAIARNASLGVAPLRGYPL